MSVTMEIEGGGSLRMWEEAGRVFFRCEHDLCRDGLYKVWVRGSGGEMLLGTLMPEGGRLILCRAMWPMELRRCGCWPVQSARCAMAYAFHKRQQDGWFWEENPRRLVDDETGNVGEWCRMLCKKGETWFELASPAGKDSGVPLSHLFCFARPERIRGELHLIWRFDAQGRPCLPNMSGEQESTRSR